MIPLTCKATNLSTRGLRLLAPIEEHTVISMNQTPPGVCLFFALPCHGVLQGLSER